jgi:uncharacterized repeat protein (TIGR02543 family)
MTPVGVQKVTEGNIIYNYLYYERQRYTLSFQNVDTVVESTSDIMYGQPLSGYEYRNDDGGVDPPYPSGLEPNAYVFDGWYIDKDYSVKYDFSAKVTRNFTLYAKWNGAEKTENMQITLTVGEKKAVVNGETKENDVAPMIKDDRAFLPARFVAESLGAEVLWDAEAKTVTIQKENTKIVLTIGEKDAEINGETVVSDVAPFIENDRTYLPLRFVSENLGATVSWDNDTRKVTIVAE